MYTANTATNHTRWSDILVKMTGETNHLRHGLSGIECAFAPRQRVRYHTHVRTKIAWERLLLPLLILACAVTYRNNSSLEQQYQQDRATVYSNLSVQP